MEQSEHKKNIHSS